jgi:hypothetical protein
MSMEGEPCFRPEGEAGMSTGISETSEDQPGHSLRNHTLPPWTSKTSPKSHLTPVSCFSLPGSVLETGLAHQVHQFVEDSPPAEGRFWSAGDVINKLMDLMS